MAASIRTGASAQVTPFTFGAFTGFLPTPLRKIGMDMTAPYMIYIDGEEFATFPSESEADAVFIELRDKMRGAAERGAQ